MLLHGTTKFNSLIARMHLPIISHNVCTKYPLSISVTLKSQFQFQFETSVSVSVHSVAVNPLCISCLITWSELGKLLIHMDFCLFF